MQVNSSREIRRRRRHAVRSTLEAYLPLLDWTGRQLRADKPGVIPARLQPILQRLAVNADCWLDTIRQFGRWFRRAVGRLSSLAAFANRRGKHWFQGQRMSQLAFG